MSQIISIGSYTPPWTDGKRPVRGPDEDAVTMAVAAGRAADPRASASRVVGISRDLPLLEGGGGAPLLAGLSLVAALLTLGVPSRVGRAAVPVTPAAGSPQPTAVAAEVAVAEAPAAGNETAEAARERTSA